MYIFYVYILLISRFIATAHNKTERKRNAINEIASPYLLSLHDAIKIVSGKILRIKYIETIILVKSNLLKYCTIAYTLQYCIRNIY